MSLPHSSGRRMRRLGERGQFIPMTYMLLFTSVFFLVAVINMYMVAQAKLQAQNIADAVALAVAALEAKSINVVMDRDEWMNHMYPDSQINKNNKNQFPGISDAAKHPFANSSDNPDLQQYAQLVNTINMAQTMFQAAYNRFLGATDGTTGQNYGPGGLSAILHEITALNDANVRVMVFNTDDGESKAAQHQQDLINNGKANFPITGSDNIEPQGMASVPFVNEEVHIQNQNETLTEALYGKGKVPPGTQPVGWMRPDWSGSKDHSTLKVTTGAGQNSAQIGAGAIVIKHIQLMSPFFRDVYLTAESKAYVVKDSGLSVQPGTLRASATGGTTGDPPPHFFPTYYVKLGARS